MYRLLVDMGNTNIKMALFENDFLLQKNSISLDNFKKKLSEILKKYTIKSALICSVLDSEKTKENLIFLEKFIRKVVIFSDKTKLPFKNLYKSKKTLGLDRLALVNAAANFYPQKNVLIIDSGTCITYDIKNKKQEYLGGAISLGLQMRYNAIHNQTAQLPQLFLDKNNSEKQCNFTANNTKDCIKTGVMAGFIFEIQEMIKVYKKQYADLKIILTGGDADYLANHLKIPIFARSNFLLEGLLQVLLHNE